MPKAMKIYNLVMLYLTKLTLKLCSQSTQQFLWGFHQLKVASAFDAVLHEVQELQENQGGLKECFENLKAHHQWQYTGVVKAL